MRHKCFKEQALLSLQDRWKMNTPVFFYKVFKRRIVSGLYFTIRRLCDTNASKARPYHHYRTYGRCMHKFRLYGCQMADSQGNLSHDTRAMWHKCYQAHILPSLQDRSNMNTLVFFYKVVEKLMVRGLYLTM